MTLLELLGLLRKNMVMVVALPVAAALVAMLFSMLVLPKVYTAETSLYALNRSTSAASTTEPEGITVQELQSAQMLANDFAELAKNSQVRRKVATNLGLNSLSGYSISVSSSNTTRIIKLSATGPDPEMAAKIANALTQEVGNTAVQVMGIEAVNVITEAEVPQFASGPPSARYTLVAFLAGLFLAVAIVVVRDMLDTTVHADSELESLTGMSVLGRFPLIERGRV